VRHPSIAVSTISLMGQNTKLRGDRRMSAFAPKADISRFMSTPPARLLARNPEYLSELYLQNIPHPASIPSGRITSQDSELNLWNDLSKLTQDFDRLTRSLIEEREQGI
jgi:hypothetical protein